MLTDAQLACFIFAGPALALSVAFMGRMLVLALMEALR